MEKKSDKKNVHHNGLNHDACVSKISVFLMLVFCSICTPFRRMRGFFIYKISARHILLFILPSVKLRLMARWHLIIMFIFIAVKRNTRKKRRKIIFTVFKSMSNIKIYYFNCLYKL